MVVIAIVVDLSVMVHELSLDALTMIEKWSVVQDMARKATDSRLDKRLDLITGVARRVATMMGVSSDNLIGHDVTMTVVMMAVEETTILVDKASASMMLLVVIIMTRKVGLVEEEVAFPTRGMNTVDSRVALVVRTTGSETIKETDKVDRAEVATLVVVTCDVMSKVVRAEVVSDGTRIEMRAILTKVIIGVQVEAAAVARVVLEVEITIRSVALIVRLFVKEPTSRLVMARSISSSLEKKDGRMLVARSNALVWYN